ncbi:SMODS domain-containing nucleotidyltransferase [Peribacillus kribbensis]|uniref:SMODS domain-containing nucleotidyltransferase n=1 Tax=Peribacillus kribbensis TaxID=356658 RepID=UPI00040D25D3|nr:nucleotidyltransferase domain-containing protein [Peribacillus kribbensis]
MNLTPLLKGLRTKNHDIISYRYHRIVKTINNYYWGISSDDKNCRYVGSYGRGTAIKGFSDVDIIVKLPKNEFQRFNSYRFNGQSALLQNVKKALDFSYSRTSTKGDGQVVVVIFSDGIKFEIVPSFENDNGTLTYPDSNKSGTWLECDPAKEIKAINIVNKVFDGQVKNVCRLTRAWKVTNNVDISGALIDALATNFFLSEDRKFDSTAFAFGYFLLYLGKQNGLNHWYVPGSNNILYRENYEFEKKALKSLDDFLSAIKYQDTYNSHYFLRKLFGDFLNGVTS